MIKDNGLIECIKIKPTPAMKWTISTIILIIFLSCNSTYNSEKITELKENYKVFSKAGYNFPNGEFYFLFDHYTVNDIIDTLQAVQRQIFPEDFPLDELEQDISRWIRDSIFISDSHPLTGTLKIDSVNTLKMDPALGYYLDPTITPRPDIYGKCLYLKNSSHTVTIKGKKIYYNIVPANGKLLNEEGIFRIETTGNYIPDHLRSLGNTDKANIRYKCERYKIDWYFTIASDHFFNASLAIPITDTCYYYRTTL
jgi:hypothetical protein